MDPVIGNLILGVKILAGLILAIGMIAFVSVMRGRSQNADKEIVKEKIITSIASIVLAAIVLIFLAVGQKAKSVAPFLDRDKELLSAGISYVPYGGWEKARSIDGNSVRFVNPARDEFEVRIGFGETTGPSPAGMREELLKHGQEIIVARQTTLCNQDCSVYVTYGKNPQAVPGMSNCLKNKYYFFTKDGKRYELSLKTNCDMYDFDAALFEDSVKTFRFR